MALATCGEAPPSPHTPARIASLRTLATQRTPLAPAARLRLRVRFFSAIIVWRDDALSAVLGDSITEALGVLDPNT